MKKIFMFLAVIGVMAFTAQYAAAQDQAAAEDTTATEAAAPAAGEAGSLADLVAATQQDVEAAAPAAGEAGSLADLVAATQQDVPLHQQLKTQFIDGGPGFMSLIVLCLILGLAVCIERIIYLSLSKTNTKKLLAKIEEALNNGGLEAAKEVCRNTRGPVASIFYQGLLRADQGVEVVEKTIVSYGSVQMSLMENGLSWIGLFISVGPSLGFLGTVVGMVQAFDAIQVAGDISPNVVAGGMKVALITTVGGLIVAIILQIFYNYIVSRIDAISIEMEDTSITLVDMLTKYQEKK